MNTYQFRITIIFLLMNPLQITGLVTVKYIYGPATVASSSDAIIGTSISGRLEAGVTVDRLTAINMPMKGYNVVIHLTSFQMLYV